MWKLAKKENGLLFFRKYSSWDPSAKLASHPSSVNARHPLARLRVRLHVFSQEETEAKVTQ